MVRKTGYRAEFGQTSRQPNLSLLQRTSRRSGGGAYSNKPWPPAFMPGSIVLSSQNAVGQFTEYLPVEECKSTGSDHLDLSNREQAQADSMNLNMEKSFVEGSTEVTCLCVGESAQTSGL
ncbi:MAG: hypothetical protein ABSG96_21395 [Terracidiphilus sp.]